MPKSAVDRCREVLLAVLALAMLPGAVVAGLPASEKLNVVATIPDLADIVREIGGDRVDVKTLTRGRENLHAVTARPSHLVAMNRADVFFQVGLALETAFVPGMLEVARNKRIRPGAPGFVNVSDGWEVIGMPTSLSRQGGDVHPYGNPHMNLDPRGGAHIAKAVRDGLVRVDPGSKADYEKRYEAYAKKLDAAQARWRKVASKLEGKKAVVYHEEFEYLANTYKLDIVASIELKPGIPPTPNHLARVISQMKSEGVKVILVAPWSQNRDVKRVAERTGARIVELPNQAGGSEKTKTWIQMMDHVHETLLDAFAESRE